MSDDFGAREVPLIPGALYGVRGFKINDDGTLRPLHRNPGMTYDQGVHTAECKLGGMLRMTFIGGGSFTYGITNSDANTNWHPESKSPDLFCTCGFYAYFDTPNHMEYLQGGVDNHVNGIVRATGKCIVGDLGFKAEKIQIVGLICDPDAGFSFKSWFGNAMREVSENLVKIPMKYYWIAMLVQFALIIAEVKTKSKALDIITDATTLMIWSLVIVQVASGFYMARRLKHMFDEKPHPVPPQHIAQQIKEHYPDVAYFSSLEEAKKVFPLSKASDLPDVTK